MKPIFKFNNGNGAILCHRCSIIIKSNISEDEASKSELYYCDKCKQKILNQKGDSMTKCVVSSK